MPRNNTFLGTGMKFPPQVNPATGRFVTASEQESVKESIFLILSTQVDERAMRPDFGTNLLSYTFIDVNDANLTMMRRTLTEQIVRQEPRVSDVVITLEEGSSGAILFDIRYTIISTNTQDNLVYPFYLNMAVEEEAEDPEYYGGEDGIVEEV